MSANDYPFAHLKPMAVREQLKAGIYTVKRAQAFMNKIQEAEAKFAEELGKIVDNEKDKLMIHKKSREPDRMDFFVHSWTNLHSQLFAMAQEHARAANQIKLQIEAPLGEMYKSLVLQDADFDKRYEDMFKMYSKSQSEVQKAKKKVATAVKSAKSQSIKEIKEKGKEKGKLGKLLAGKSADDLRTQAVALSMRYEEVITRQNLDQKQFRDALLPSFLADLQKAEDQRLASLHQLVLSFAQMRVAYQPKIQAACQGMVTSVAEYNRHSDLKAFASTTALRDPNELVFSYTLPCNPEDIKAGRYDGNPNSVFKSTLQHCMLLQEKNFPGYPLPLILPTLIQAIMMHNGPRTEGIFRISASTDDRNALFDMIDNGQYIIKNNIFDVHVFASLLKLWLRELAEPLIPEELYDLAIDVAKNENSGASQIQGLMGKLDRLNAGIITALCAMTNEIVKPENQQINKMSLGNMAVVFAPSFLRNPSEDANTIMANTKYETQFACLLLEFGITNGNYMLPEPPKNLAMGLQLDGKNPPRRKSGTSSVQPQLYGQTASRPSTSVNSGSGNLNAGSGNPQLYGQTPARPSQSGPMPPQRSAANSVNLGAPPGHRPTGSVSNNGQFQLPPKPGLVQSPGQPGGVRPSQSNQSRPPMMSPQQY